MWLLGIEFRTSARSCQSHSLQLALLRPKDLFIIIHKYPVANFRCTRRGRQISLRVGGCEPPCGFWDLNSGPPEKQSVLLTTEPSLQPAWLVFIFLNLFSVLSFEFISESFADLQIEAYALNLISQCARSCPTLT